MIKNLIAYLDYGLFAELALSLFLLIFLAVVTRTLLIRHEQTDYQSRIVLNDEPKE